MSIQQQFRVGPRSRLEIRVWGYHTANKRRENDVTSMSASSQTLNQTLNQPVLETNEFFKYIQQSTRCHPTTLTAQPITCAIGDCNDTPANKNKKPILWCKQNATNTLWNHMKPGFMKLLPNFKIKNQPNLVSNPLAKITENWFELNAPGTWPIEWYGPTNHFDFQLISRICNSLDQNFEITKHLDAWQFHQTSTSRHRNLAGLKTTRKNRRKLIRTKSPVTWPTERYGPTNHFDSQLPPLQLPWTKL